MLEGDSRTDRSRRPRTGKAINSFDLVDQAKLGHTAGLVDIVSTVEPTLEGIGAAIPQADHDRRKASRIAEQGGHVRQYRRFDESLQNYHGLRTESGRPTGDTYFAVEGANGELGFYVVSDGKDRPYRVRVRPPCFFGMAGLHTMLKGYMVADIVATFGSINMIAGELDR